MFQPPNPDLQINTHKPKQPSSPSLSSPEPLLNLLTSFMSHISQSINSHNHTLPIFTFTQQLCPQTLCYNLNKRQQFCLTTASLNKFVRLLQICVLCIDNLKSGKYITKRNLYYKLEKYYQQYQTIDTDLRLLCQNLYYLSQCSGQIVGKEISRTDLGIVPSNRCIMYGLVQIKADGQLLSKSSSTNINILTLPTCRIVQAKCKSKSVIIVQKQSFFYEIVSLVKQYKLSDQYLVISAKGYPDQNTRNLLLQICEQKEQLIDKMYYLGDYDVYGFDIFLFYALGDWTCKGLLSKIHLLPLANYFPTKFNTQLLSMMPKFSKQDLNKTKQIKNKLDALAARKQEFEANMAQKICQISKYFEKFANEGQKCELELLNEQALKQCWIDQIILEQNKK